LILFEPDSHGIAEHGDAILAAIEAGATRFQPVCMDGARNDHPGFIGLV
jgi:hypothetical protein